VKEDSVDSAKATSLVNFGVEAGERYLAAGGPTSRIEELLDQAGEVHKIHVETFATPTGIFISAVGPADKQPVTLIGRIRNSSTDLSELIRIEKIIESFVQNKISITDATEQINHPRLPHHQVWNQIVTYLSLFVLGAAASYVNYGSSLSALVSGLLCLAVGFLSGPLRQQMGWSGIFTDFLGSFFALVIAGIISVKINRPADSFAIGTLILLVPGLSLTNAITELAEQNFVSGTAKMMKSILILLAIGTAFLLVSDLSQLLLPGVDFNRWGLNKEQSFMTQLICQTLIIISFTGVFRSPYRYIPVTLIPGLLSWYVFHKLNYADFLVLSSFVPALTVGIISLILSRWLKVPSQIFSVPGILSLVPGMLALSSFYAATDPSGTGGGTVFFQVTIIASSIVFGLLTARIPFGRSTR
jgi:uncharacterized membrane protein YjjP (DUF1212 family)